MTKYKNKMQDTLVSKLFGSNPNPRFKQRGLLLDISRNRVPKMEWLYQLINALEVLRFNELQLHTEHTFAYKNILLSGTMPRP